MIRTDPFQWTAAHRFVGAIAGSFVALAVMPFAATVLRGLAGGAPPPRAVAFTLLALAGVAVAAAVQPGRRARGVAAGAGLAAALAALALGAGLAAFALLPVVGLAAIAGERIARSAGALGTTRRGWSLLWAALAVLSVVQMARLSTYIHDPRTPFVVATTNPFWNGHQCLPAYLYGAELAERGEANLYEARHWPALDPAAAPASRLGLTVEDPYQYPPQFLLLPRLALALTADAAVLRAGWFALQLALFAAAFAGLASWIGGRAGRCAHWLLPMVLLTFPLTFNFQFGQFHLAAVSLAILAMLAFARQRRASGGLLLAGAILSKVFPVVLLAVLAAGRRWRDLAWTAAAGAALTALAFAVLGPAPFRSFVDYQLPRLGSGEAFAFDLAWPELAELVRADNQGVFGIARKLGFERAAAAWIGKLFGVAVLFVAAVVGVRLGGGRRWANGAAWLALLGLASLASPGAWGDYVPGTAVWLLALLPPLAARSRGWRWLLAASVPFQGFLLGTFPLGAWAPTAALLPLSLVGAVLLLALNGGVLLHLASLREEASAPAAGESANTPARAAA